MKKSILITLCFLYSYNLALFAQITNTQYRQLVDYVNCRYAISYIDATRNSVNKNKNGEDYLRDFDKYKSSFKQNVQKYTDIYYGFDIKNKKSTTIFNTISRSASTGLGSTKTLWTFLNDKKNHFNSSWTSQQLIENLLLLPENTKENNHTFKYSTLLENTKKDLSDDLSKILKELVPKDNNSLGTTESELKVHVDSNNSTKDILGISRSRKAKSQSDSIQSGIIDKAKEAKLKKNNSFDFSIIIISILIVIIGYFAFKYRDKLSNFFQKSKTEPNNKLQIDLEYYQKRCKELENENNKLQYLENDNSKLRYELKQLKSRTGTIQKPETENKTTYSPIHLSEREIPARLNTANMLFADVILFNEFHKITEHPDSDTIYQLQLNPSKRTATFNVYFTAYKRVIKNYDFVDGCERLRINQQPTDLEVENGEAELGDSGKWRITKKAIIKFI